MTKIDINRASAETRERIAAALALAEAASVYWGETECLPGWVKESTDMHEAVHAYRATAPKKLRTRAEVNTHIVGVVRNRLGGGPYHSAAVCADLVKLAAEPVAETLEPPEVSDETAEWVALAISYQDRATAAEARIAELEADLERERVSHGATLDELTGLDKSLDAKHEKLVEVADKLRAERATNATLRADNERFAEELLEARNGAKQVRLDYEQQLDAKHEKLVELSAELIEARKPCERRHLTEAEEALCQFTEVRTPWEPSDFDGGGLEGICRIMNNVRDERRQQTLERHPPRNIPEDDLVPVERCSCEEAERLREAAERALAFLDGCSFLPEGEGSRLREALREALS